MNAICIIKWMIINFFLKKITIDCSCTTYYSACIAVLILCKEFIEFDVYNKITIFNIPAAPA